MPVVQVQAGVDAQTALDRLRNGNARFVRDDVPSLARVDRARRVELLAGQSPFAIILGCADSRVPAEIIFDQGMGDLFVIRVAGNIVAPSLVGSVELAAERFGTRLVVVLGHSGCGAVNATMQELARVQETESPHFREIVDRMRRAVGHLVPAHPSADFPDASTLATAVRANIHESVLALRHGSNVLEELIRTDGLMVVGAEYSLATGVVEFFA